MRHVHSQASDVSVLQRTGKEIVGHAVQLEAFVHVLGDQC